MEIEYDAQTYGQRIADVYDQHYRRLDTEDTVEFLADLTPKRGRILELGVGTGRIALPLAGRGLDVTGIDASPAMIEQLRSKPHGDKVNVVLGDMADVGADGPFALVFVVFNTFFAIRDQDSQVRCFENVAAQLAPGGRFVVEAFVPDPARLQGGQHVAIADLGVDRTDFNLTRFDLLSQRAESAHVVLTEGGTRILPVQLRYVWPSEFDLMARIAGLQLEHRFSGWRREPLTPTSAKHVSVWNRPLA